MGLLDQFSNLDENQTQGLLAAAAQMLQQSGPSRTPTSFGQIAGGGMMAYQSAMTEAKKRKQEEEQQRQMAEMRTIQMRAAQGSLQDSEAARAQQAAIQAAARGSMQTPGMMAGAMPGGPTPGNAAQIPNMEGGFDNESFIRQVMQIDPMKGLALAQQLKKQGTEYGTDVKVGVGPDGRPFSYLVGKDGTQKRLDGTLPRDEMKVMDLNNRKVAYNSFALKPGEEFKIGQSPDSAASVGASYANAAATREIANATRDAAGIQRDMNTEMKLGDDYRTQSKGFKEVSDAYRQINATLDKATTSPAATLASATKFMKLLDPGSVVRESELGMALAASGVFDRATNYYQTLLKGRVLTPNQAEDFKNITAQIYGAAQGSQQAIDQNYRKQAEAYGLRPDMIVQDLGQSRKPSANPMPEMPKPNANNKGRIIQDNETGKRYQSNGMQWKEM